MGVSSIEERKSTCLIPKAYQPADDMDGMAEFPRKKKMFSSSSFYEEPNAVYPTIEEQVQLCRKIAESLSDDCNVKSKGANMFFKRVKKAEKWIVAESNVHNEEESVESKDPAKMPYVRPSTDGPTRLKLILDPRHIVDMQRLLKEGVDIVKHDAISPEVCHDLVKDLNSPTGRGAALFAKRKKKSEEWIVDEEKVKHLLQTRYSGEYLPPDLSMPPLSGIDTHTIAETVIRAAESKVMTYPNAVPHVPVIESLDGTREWTKSQQQSDAYKFRSPKGWTSNTPASSLPVVPEASVLPEKSAPMLETTASSTLPRYSPISRTMNFSNFNSSPRAWNADMCSQFRPVVIKSVKPPSVLVQ